MVPPPAVTPQVTVAGDNPVTVAVYCCVPPRGTFTYPGEMVTVWANRHPPTRITTLNKCAIRFANLIIYTPPSDLRLRGSVAGAM